MSNTSSSLSPSSASSVGISEAGWWADGAGTAHERGSILFILADRTFGPVACDPGSFPAAGFRRSGAAFYCSWCGEVWARMVLCDRTGRQLPLDVEQVACEKHPDQWNLAGSLLPGRLLGWLDLLPPALVVREFELHLRWEMER